jgi:competence protein ComEC
MRLPRLGLWTAIGLLVLVAGCAQLAEDRERLLDQGGDVVADDPVREPGEVPQPADANLTVHFVDVGQGDGVVVHLPDYTAVYDTGRWHGDSAEAVRDHLRAEDADPDALAISHPDADHAGGCDVVLQAFAIEAIYHPGLSKDTQTWRDCRQAMQAEGAPVYTDADLDLGQALAWSTHAQIRVLHVDAEARDANAGSLALSLAYGNVTLALTGDMTCEAEDRVLAADAVDDVTVTQVAHHGSATSTCQPWLEATQPEVGVIGVGADNRYGHPHDEVLDRLTAHGVTVYRTDDHGTVEVTTDGEAWDVRTEHGEAAFDHEPDASEEQPANATGVAIDEVRYDPPGDDNEDLNGERVELANTGNATVDVGGWTLADDADHVYTVPANTTLAPDDNVTVHTGQGEDTRDALYWGRSQAVWNNAGDTAVLHDASGSLVDEHTW